jgi:broad specificity phosphatase PhoE
MARVRSTSLRLRQHQAPFIAIFSHGLFVRALLWSIWTGIDDATPETMQRYYHFAWSIWMPNGAIMKSEFKGDGSVYFTPFDTSHLPAE